MCKPFLDVKWQSFDGQKCTTEIKKKLHCDEKNEQILGFEQVCLLFVCVNNKQEVRQVLNSQSKQKLFSLTTNV